MKDFSLNSRPVTIGLWTLTGVVTFCLGRLTTPAPDASGRPASGSGNKVSSSTNTGLQGSESAWAKAGLKIESQVQTTEELTNGRPIGEWLKNLMAQDDEIIRTTGFIRLLETLDTPEKIKSALAVINPSFGRGGWGRGGREYGMLLQKWTQLDPKSAADFSKDVKGMEERWIATTSVLRTWARSSPEDALAWAKANGTSTNDADQGGPERFWGGGGGGNMALSTVISQMARTNLDRALEEASSQPIGRRSRMADTLMDELMSQRGLESSRTTVANLPAGELRDSLTAQLAGRMAAKSPSEATSWVMSMPASEGRNRALSQVIDEWAKKDPAAAGEYLTKLPPSKENDPAVRSFAFNIINKDPEGAMAWASSINDGEDRAQTIDVLTRMWSRQDPKAAQAWAAKNGKTVPASNFRR